SKAYAFYVSGVFHGALLQKFGVRNVALCLSCTISISFGISFFATSITFLVISIGLFGISGIFISTAAATGRHFHGKQGIFLVSIVNVGSGLGGVIFPYVFNYMMDSFWLRGTYLLTGGIFLNIIPLTLLWKPPITKKSRPSANFKDLTGVENKAYKVSSGELNNIRTNKCDVRAIELKKETLTSVKCEMNTGDGEKYTLFTTMKKLVTDKAFMCFAFGLAAAYSCNTVFLVYVVDALQDSGLSETSSTLGLLLLNLAGILGRFLPGFLTQIKHITVLTVPIIACIMIILSQLGFTLLNSTSTHFLSCIIAGTAIGMCVSTFGVVTLKLVGIARQSNAMGLCLSLSGITNAFLGPLGGMCYYRPERGF
ncbi:MOT14-like protein, partial [Mya arenaria]